MTSESRKRTKATAMGSSVTGRETAATIPEGNVEWRRLQSIGLVQIYRFFCRFGWSKRKVPMSKSGRVIKGRGVFVSEPEMIEMICLNPHKMTHGCILILYLWLCSLHNIMTFSTYHRDIEHRREVAPGVSHRHTGSRHKSASSDSRTWR